MWKHIAANGMSFLIVALIAAAAALGWGRSQWDTSGPLETAAFFEVEQGDTLRGVSERLEEAGVIRSAAIFRVGVRALDRSGDLRFGNYEIPASATMDEVLDIVTAGGPSSFRYRATYVLRNSGTGQLRLSERVPGTGEVEEIVRFSYEEGVPEAYSELVEAEVPMIYRLVIPEGLTSWQVVQGLLAADFLSGEVPDIPAEGTLAPATIEVSRGEDRLELIAEMRDAQEQILAEAWENRAEDLPISTPEEALILASIIEKETSVAEERGLVASVFTNRLNVGMRLQTDPTVIYGVTNGRGILGRGLRQSELRGETPWNTYVIDGLPPTPIANPGADAINAALNPDDSEYIFFVADGTGGHAFSVTLEEHNRNVARWREIEAERNNGN
ncbi:endolytic transglycosylase MltG [Gymnodinialimonas ulvae]|uniref:endolytic transglycosylase MltG n=1 Tax=Gymnodinialimonas ulvae TaxID=3126504 RepID=UPI0030A52310